MLKNHMIVDYLIFVVRNCSDDATRGASKNNICKQLRIVLTFHQLSNF